MNVTIAIPTYNRAAEVEKTLAGLARLDATGCPEYEILVIDNRSTDDTAAVVARMAPRFGGRLRYVREEAQGLNHARNRAVREAKYDIVAYLDDDVDVDPRWLWHLADAFAAGDVAGVGGRAHLVYPGPKPRWLDESFEGLLTKVELGPVRRPSGVGELFGVNLSIRKDWLLRAGPFRPDLDRVGNCLVSGGDDEMVERVQRLGGRFLYEPGAVVGHRVPPARLTRTWFWKRCYWGHVSATRTWPDRDVSYYQFVRRVWHVALALAGAAGAGVRHGPRSAPCFAWILKAVSRAGLCAGLAGELRRSSGRTGPTPSEPTALPPAGALAAA